MILGHLLILAAFLWRWLFFRWNLFVLLWLLRNKEDHPQGEVLSEDQCTYANQRDLPTGSSNHGWPLQMAWGVFGAAGTSVWKNFFEKENHVMGMGHGDVLFRGRMSRECISEHCFVSFYYWHVELAKSIGSKSEIKNNCTLWYPRQSIAFKALATSSWGPRTPKSLWTSSGLWNGTSHVKGRWHKHILVPAVSTTSTSTRSRNQWCVPHMARNARWISSLASTESLINN